MDIEEKIYVEEKILRINIDGYWSSTEFTTLFESITFLYQLALEVENIDFIDVQIYKSVVKSQLSKDIYNFNGELFKKLDFPSTYENAENIFRKFFLPSPQRYVESKPDLKIKQIQYASPGYTDFVGLGKIIEQVFALIRYYIPNKKEILENREKELDILSKQIQFLELAGYSKKEIKKMYDIKNSTLLSLQELAIQDKITNFEVRKL